MEHKSPLLQRWVNHVQATGKILHVNTAVSELQRGQRGHDGDKSQQIKQVKRSGYQFVAGVSSLSFCTLNQEPKVET